MRQRRLSNGAEVVPPSSASTASPYAYEGEFDVAVLFSQDQDIAEASDEVRRITPEHDRWTKEVSAYPSGKGTTNDRRINRAD